MALYDTMKNLIAGATLYADTPLGTINAFGGSTAPEGWLLCQGQAISRTTYEDLFKVIGTAFGAGDGSTTFNIPDMRESVPKGAGLTGKSSNHMDADGLALGEFIDDRTQSHTHTVNVADGYSYTQIGQPLNWGVGGSTTLYANNNTKTTSAPSGRTGATTEVKSVGVNYIIKVKQSGIPQDLLSNLEEMLNDRNILSWGD